MIQRRQKSLELLAKLAEQKEKAALQKLAEVQKAHERLDFLNARLADPATYQSGGTVQELQKDYQQCQEAVKRLSSQWEEEALALEELEESFWKDKQLDSQS